MPKKRKTQELEIPELPGFGDLLKVDLYSDKEDALDEEGLTPLPEALPITVKRLRTVMDVQDAMADILEAKIIGLDIETTGLDPRTAKMRLIQIAVERTVYVIDCWEVNPRCVQSILASAKYITGQNLQFDLGFM